MSPIRDTNLVVFTGTEATGLAYGTGGSVISSAFEIEGTGVNGLALHVMVPLLDSDAPAATGLAVYVLASSSTTITSASTYQICGARHHISAVGEYIIPFHTNKRTVIFDFVPEEASGGFKIPVYAWITEQFGLDWTRIPEWH